MMLNYAMEVFNMKDLTCSVYTFEDLIKGNYLYVDKTEYIYKLVQQAKGCYFFSRPRRFGKSLTLSTLKAIFQGKKELFEGLAILKKDYDWQEYPVIHLDMGNCNAKNASELNFFLYKQILNIVQAENLDIDFSNKDAGLAFQDLILALSKNDKKVVILVDEYDKPILGNVKNPAVNEILQVLKGFYSVIKKAESHERFVFITGVSKFAHVSIFSDLNNLTDISMHSDYATMLGYTQEELNEHFGDRIEGIATKRNIPIDELKKEIKEWYNGFRFHSDVETVYNPVSISNFFFNNGEFNNYWFDTGTPTFLIELIKDRDFNFEFELGKPVDAMAFKAYDIDNLEALPLLLQTGYLTIKSSERNFGEVDYWLDFPNREVNQAFNTYLLNGYTGIDKTGIASSVKELARAVVKGDLSTIEKTLKVFFSGVDYTAHKKSEAVFEMMFYTIFRILGCYIEAESHTNDGRIDLVMQSEKYIFLFELKLNNDKTALEQIKKKEYFNKYLCSNKQITIVGVNFDTDKGQIIDWQSEVLPMA